MLHLAILFIGVVIGIILTYLVSRKPKDSPVGSIIFDRAISEEIPYLGVERASDLDIIRSKKYVTLKVEIVKSNTQK